MRVAPAIHLSSEARAALQGLVRRRTTSVRVVERCRIVLLAADGLQDKQIAERMSVAPLMASRWRHRFLTQGVAGLVKDAPRPGRTPTITAEQVAEVIAKTTQSTPANATQWSRSTMAREACISESSVGRIWRAHGLKAHRVEFQDQQRSRVRRQARRYRRSLPRSPRACVGAERRREEPDTGSGSNPAGPFR